jgi:hypothetical protein
VSPVPAAKPENTSAMSATAVPQLLLLEFTMDPPARSVIPTKTTSNTRAGAM